MPTLLVWVTDQKEIVEVPTLVECAKDGESTLIVLTPTVSPYTNIQFNIVDTATLKAAQENPEDYKDLLVRMAGYSDYFNDMNADLQQEVIDRTENESF